MAVDLIRLYGSPKAERGILNDPLCKWAHASPVEGKRGFKPYIQHIQKKVILNQSETVIKNSSRFTHLTLSNTQQDIP